MIGPVRRWSEGGIKILSPERPAEPWRSSNARTNQPPAKRSGSAHWDRAPAQV